MIILILGLLIFFGIHMVPAFHDTRNYLVDSFGEGTYKAIFSLISVIGLGLAAWGFSLTPQIELYSTSETMGFVTLVLALIGFVLIFANYGNGYLRRLLKDPFAVGVALWAFGHLLSNGDWASIILFGSFLIYALTDLLTDNERIPFEDFEPSVAGDVKAVIIGSVIFGLLYYFHGNLFGVPALA